MPDSPTKKFTRDEIDAANAEREERAAQRQRDERFYQTLFDHAGTAVCLVDADGAIEKVNIMFAKLIGLSEQEILGNLNLGTLLSEGAMDLYTEVVDRTHHEQSDADLMGRVFTLTRPDGNERTVEVTFAVFPNSDKATAALFDITEHRALERAIRVKDQYLTSLLRDSHDAIIGVDMQGTIRSWNRGAFVIFGFEPDEVVGQSYVKVMPPDMNHQSAFDKIVNEITTKGFINEEEVVRTTKDGHKVLLSATRTAVKDAQGNVIGFSTLMRDITERKRMEQRLIQSERLSALGEMAAFLAHEIKNPLNSMVINLEVMKRHLPNVPEESRTKLAKYAGVLDAEIRRLDKVIGGVLDLARPVRTDTYMETDVNHVIQMLVELFEPQARRKGVSISVELAPSLPPIVGDGDQLKQAVLNLMLNGLQAIGDSGDGALSIKTARDEVGIVVSVSDSGPGIPQDVINRIFDPFFTTKKQGNGMGLSIVQRIVESHGGSVDIDTEMGTGTTFTLNLPKA